MLNKYVYIKENKTKDSKLYIQQYDIELKNNNNN